MRDAVKEIIAHLRAHESAGQTWTLAPRGGWVFEPLSIFVTSGEKETILRAART